MAKKKPGKNNSIARKKKLAHAHETQKDTAEATTDDDWISALAKKAAAPIEALPTKAERIERRNAKKRRREERKPPARGSAKDGTYSSFDAESRDAKRTNRKRDTHLKDLADILHDCVAQRAEKLPARPYLEAESLKKGKATAGNKLNEELLQPRRRDYGGLGLARPSLYISLRDPSFVPKIEEEFAEHVPGFFGKQRTKAMKRQLDGNMLWRQLAEKRNDDRKVGGKKLSDMNPDERVEAMLKAGMI